MRNTELKERIRELTGEIAYQKKIFEVKEQKIRLEEREKRAMLASDLTTYKAENKQLIARMDEHPYQLVSDMLKALVVKFPTLNINDLAINSGEEVVLGEIASQMASQFGMGLAGQGYPRQVWDDAYSTGLYVPITASATTGTALYIDDTEVEEPPDEFTQLSNHKFHELLDRFKESI